MVLVTDDVDISMSHSGTCYLNCGLLLIINPLWMAVRALHEECQFCANIRLPYISHVAAFFAYFMKVNMSHIFPHKLAFTTAILISLIFCVFLFNIQFMRIVHNV